MTDPLVPDLGPKKAAPTKKISKDGKEYHLSATANASVAPTNEHTVKNVTKQGSLTHKGLDFVTTIHYLYGLRGKFPTIKELTEEYFYGGNETIELLNDPQVQKALQERGITFPYKALGIEPPVGTETTAPLSPLQLVVANMMLDLTDSRSDRKKLQDAGITTATYQMWLRDETFNDYLRQRAEGLVGDVQHEAMLSLVDRVRSGDMNAIKYYHQLTGRFVEAKEGGGGSVGDLQQIIVRIIEIITEEVDDQDTAFRISDRLKGLITGNQIAGILPTEAAVKPVIAQARVMSDEVKHLMDKGMGYE